MQVASRVTFSRTNYFVSGVWLTTFPACLACRFYRNLKRQRRYKEAARFPTCCNRNPKDGRETLVVVARTNYERTYFLYNRILRVNRMFQLCVQQRSNSLRRHCVYDISSIYVIISVIRHFVETHDYINILFSMLLQVVSL